MGTRISDKIVNEILIEGLGKSPWSEKYPEAYRDLLKYKQDIEHSIRHILSTYWHKIQKVILEGE